MDSWSGKVAIVATPVTGETPAGENAEGKERRRGRRYPCEGFAELTHSGFILRGEIRDISQSGCFIQTKARIRLECLAEVDLRFTVSDNRYRTLARVADVRPGKGVALKFLLDEARPEEWLQALVESLSAAPVLTGARK